MANICCQIFKQLRESFLCEWLKRAVTVVCCWLSLVLVSKKVNLLTTQWPNAGGFVPGDHGFPLTFISSLLSMVVDLLYRLGKLAGSITEVKKCKCTLLKYFPCSSMFVPFVYLLLCCFKPLCEVNTRLAVTTLSVY